MPRHTSIEQAVRYIKIRWQEGNNLNEIAKMHGLDAGNLSRAFRNREGITAKQFIDKKRKEYVLRQVSKDILFGHEIGTKLGFHDDLAFYRWVTRTFGASFAELRRKS